MQRFDTCGRNVTGLAGLYDDDDVFVAVPWGEWICSACMPVMLLVDGLDPASSTTEG